MFIGFYSVANAVTMFGLVSAIVSCFLAANGNFKFAIWMMFLSFICDATDGRLARASKRTEKQVFYGVQLDSLCDAISFGFVPCFIAYSFGFNTWFDLIVYCLFILCGVIRLAYFNTLANFNPNKKVKYFRGVPIPASVFVISVLFLLTTFIPATAMAWIFRIAFIGLGLGYILNIPVKKPELKTGLILLAVEVVLLLVMAIAGDCKAPVHIEEPVDDATVSTEVSE